MCSKWAKKSWQKWSTSSSHGTESVTIALGNWLSVDKCFLINLCHQHWRGLKIELCFIEPRWSLAQLKQLSGSIRQSIACTIRGQTFADCCLYLFQVLCGDIAVWPWLSSLYGLLRIRARHCTHGKGVSLTEETVGVITTQHRRIYWTVKHIWKPFHIKKNARWWRNSK